LTFDPSPFAETFDERRRMSLQHRICCSAVHQHAHAPHPLALLGPRHHRPRRRATYRRNELPPRHTQDRHRHFPRDNPW
jgi:hypothetical protein